MQKKNSIGAKMLAVILGILIILMIVAITVLFLTNTTKQTSGKVNKASKQQDTDVSKEVADEEDTYPEITLDDFSVGSDSGEQASLGDQYSAGDEITSEESSGDYLIADSDSRYLTEDDLVDLTSEELSLVRNEIYARHGYIFDNEDFQSYFESKGWYVPLYSKDSFPDDELNEFEKENAKFIRKYEEENE